MRHAKYNTDIRHFFEPDVSWWVYWTSQIWISTRQRSEKIFEKYHSSKIWNWIFTFSEIGALWKRQNSSVYFLKRCKSIFLWKSSLQEGLSYQPKTTFINLTYPRLYPNIKYCSRFVRKSTKDEILFHRNIVQSWWAQVCLQDEQARIIVRTFK